MLNNSFIPISIPFFHDYLINKFSVNIYEIPNEDWINIICNKYCKNIVDGKFCLKKHKKHIPNAENNRLCSKCCEKKGIKRKKFIKEK